jgi:hypothetical protein
VSKKPLCVDCKERPMALYCRCWECLPAFEQQTDAINRMQPSRVVGSPKHE